MSIDDSSAAKLRTSSGINSTHNKFLIVVLANQLHAGFLRTAAPLRADIVLILEIAMGLMLLFGLWLARTRRFKWHALCQSSIVLLNTIVIAFAMLPAFSSRVLPKLATKFNRPYYWLSTAHAALGTVSEASGLYIVVAAGTKLLPARFRLKSYKLWMRATLALWWTTLFFGVATYVRWYIPWP